MGENLSAEKGALPELDRGALVMADLAWIETPGSSAQRTKAAIRAYLWATRIADQKGAYPSLNQWRAASQQAGESGEGVRGE